MKKIELVKGIESSVLGFGCAPILGSEGGSKSKRAIECAIDCGINHFDVARSYGYGEAERFLGKVLAARRPNMIIASKFGIKANSKAKWLAPIKPLVRYLKQTLKAKQSSHVVVSKPPTLNVADSFHYRIMLNEIDMRKSLDESLKALKTDYLDYFFIHEPLQTILNVDELCNAALALKQAGKIRAFGIAYAFDQEYMHSDYLNQFDVLQFNNSSDNEAYNTAVAIKGNRSNIIFSPLRSANKGLTVADKLLKVHSDFPKSVILCSMFNEKHIKSNASIQF